MGYSVGTGTSHQCAAEALRCRLYERGGLLKYFLMNIVADKSHKNAVALLRDNRVADRKSQNAFAGVAVLMEDGQLMVYVRPEIRGQGWGRKLVELLKITTVIPREKWYAVPGDQFIKSYRFWTRVGIDCRTDVERIPLTTLERDKLKRTGRCLVFRGADRLTRTVYEMLYVSELYTSDYSEKQDGLKGHLHAILHEEWCPVDYVMFHLKVENQRQTFISLGTVEVPKYENAKSINIQVYVDPAHRREGLGTQMLKYVSQAFPHHELHGYHTESSKVLYERFGVRNRMRT